MQIITADQVPVVNNPHSLDVRHLHKTDDVAATQITLQPGEVVKPNKAPVDAFSCVLNHMEQPDASARSQALVAVAENATADRDREEAPVCRSAHSSASMCAPSVQAGVLDGLTGEVKSLAVPAATEALVAWACTRPAPAVGGHL